MQHISLYIAKEFNQTNNHSYPDEDCLPEGKSYGENDSLDLPDPDQTFSESVYDPYDDPDSPYFRLPFNDDTPTLIDPPSESLSKTLRGVIVDEDGWCTTDIPEGSQLAAGEVIERQFTEDPLPGWPDGDDESEEEDDNAPLPDFDDSRF